MHLGSFAAVLVVRIKTSHHSTILRLLLKSLVSLLSATLAPVAKCRYSLKHIGSYFIPEPYGKEAPLLTQGLILATIGQYDLGIATFLFLQLPLAGRTVWQLGSQTHKDTFLFDLTNLKTIWGWGLTER